MNKLEFARKTNKLTLNKLSSSVIKSNLALVQNEIKWTKLKHLILNSITTLGLILRWKQCGLEPNKWKILNWHFFRARNSCLYFKNAHENHML